MNVLLSSLRNKMKFLIKATVHRMEIFVYFALTMVRALSILTWILLNWFIYLGSWAPVKFNQITRLSRIEKSTNIFNRQSKIDYPHPRDLIITIKMCCKLTPNKIQTLPLQRVTSNMNGERQDDEKEDEYTYKTVKCKNIYRIVVFIHWSWYPR